MPFVLARLLILFQLNASDNEPRVFESRLFRYDGETWMGQSIQVFENAWQSKRVIGALLGIFTLISAVCYHQAEMRQRMVCAKIRIACCSVIFRKVNSYLNYFSLYAHNNNLYAFRPFACRS